MIFSPKRNYSRPASSGCQTGGSVGAFPSMPQTFNSLTASNGPGAIGSSV